MSLFNLLPNFINPYAKIRIPESIQEDRNKRFIVADRVPQKLEKQWELCQKQMNEETPGPFKYKNLKNSDYIFTQKANSHSESGKIGAFFFNLIGGRSFGVCHAQGLRPSMEDQHIASSFNITINGKVYPVELFGVFDGHGGPGASEYIKEHLPTVLQKTLEKFNTEKLTDAGILNSLKIAFVTIHEDFKSAFIIKQSKAYRDDSGTTATVSMILDGNIWTANTGDSRTILQNRNGQTLQLSEDAKPTDPRYARSIKKRGGFIQSIYGVYRINGILAVGRAIGDHSVGKGINPRPKITKIALSSILKDSKLILACDGIYDVASSKQVGSAVKENLKASNKTLATGIVYSAYNANSTDNLSALVVSVGIAKDRRLSFLKEFFKIFSL